MTIFTALFIMLISIISIISTEVEIQSAMNEAALEISQSSYVAYGKLLSSDAEMSGPELAKKAVQEHFHKENIDDWLCSRGVEGGYTGLDFHASEILANGKDIQIAVVYKLKVNAFGISEKELTICQRAATAAWLPYSVDRDSVSIWKMDALKRGQYFVNLVKKEHLGEAVKAGQGIDLYYKQERRLVEIFSMNVFLASYSSCPSAETDHPEKYVPNEKNISDRLLKYAAQMNDDIEKAERLLTMADGRMENYKTIKSKQLLIILPTEAQNSAAFHRCFSNIANTIYSEYGIELVLDYREEAF